MTVQAQQQEPEVTGSVAASTALRPLGRAVAVEEVLMAQKHSAVLAVAARVKAAPLAEQGKPTRVQAAAVAVSLAARADQVLLS
jgi:hypothetical protein